MSVVRDFEPDIIFCSISNVTAEARILNRVISKILRAVLDITGHSYKQNYASLSELKIAFGKKFKIDVVSNDH